MTQPNPQPYNAPLAHRIRRIAAAERRYIFEWGELWRFRELLYFLAWRDVRSRYKQTYLGASWGLLRPVISMVVMSAIFGGLAGIESGTGTPYPVFVFTGLLPWMYFASAFTGASTSIVGNGGLVTKAYFPRLYIPLASAIAPLLDLVFALSVLVGLFVWFHVSPTWRMVAAPGFVLIAVVTALGAGLWFSAVNVRFRDVAFALPFITQIWMYMTPVIYPASLVPARWRWVLELNPLSAAVGGFRWSVLGRGQFEWRVVLLGGMTAILTLILGSFVFRRAEHTFADVL